MEYSQKMPGIAKKRLIRKQFKRHHLSCNQKISITKTLGLAFLDRIRKDQISNYETDLLKIIGCFIACRGSVLSDYVPM